MIGDYLKESLEEIKKIAWPTKENTLRYTFLVIFISSVAAIFFGGLDFILSLGLEKILSLK